MFITDLFTAGRIYFESKNVASFDINDFINFIKLTTEKKSLSTGEATEIAKALNINTRDVLGYTSLSWHLGILATGHGNTYTPTRLAKDIAKNLRETQQAMPRTTTQHIPKVGTTTGPPPIPIG